MRPSYPISPLKKQPTTTSLNSPQLNSPDLPKKPPPIFSESNFLWAQPGSLCWVETSTKEKFFKAVILTRQDEINKVTVKYEPDPLFPNMNSLPKEVEFFQIMRWNEHQTLDPLKGFEDMVNMDILNEAEVINNLKLRYKNDLIFTYIGPTLLVINPYKPILSDFSAQNYRIYSEQANSKPFILRDNPPHVFAIGAKAFHQLITDSRNQAIVISGESGAGKTENTKFAMRFITSLSSESGEESKIADTPIEEKILGCNPILEAFGNAKTVRNDNSSRFGKYVKIQVHKTSKRIKGAEINNYLLEKSRVTYQAKDERNYHIFYHLLGSQNLDDLKRFKLVDENGVPLPVESFKYLNKSGCFTIESLNDSEQYTEVQKSFEKLKFTEIERYAVWAILASILHLGNIEIDDSAFNHSAEKIPCEIKNKAPFSLITELLGVNENDLTISLVMKPFHSKNETIMTTLKKDQCIGLRDSLSKGLYEKLFNWLVKRMNMSSHDSNDLLTIGLLDIFGFEKFETNSLEQLCINFTNEKLHQLYIEYVFISEKEELTGQGLKAQANSLLLPQNNNKLIELFEGATPTSLCLFSLMKDANARNQTITDESLFISITKLKENPNLAFPKNQNTNNKKFIIVHTADNVDYSIIGFKTKNIDSFPEALEKVILSSNFKEISCIYSGIVDLPIIEEDITFYSQAHARNSNYKKEFFENSFASVTHTNTNITNIDPFRSEKKREHSVSQMDMLVQKSIHPVQAATLFEQFGNQIKSLMNELNKCDANFIRCIKPNEEKIKENFRSDFILKQIKYLGVLESVKIRKESFPVRKEFNTFWNLYKSLGKHKMKIQTGNPKEMKYVCDWCLLRNLIIDENDFRRKILFGSTKIYLKQDVSNLLDRLQFNQELTKEQISLRIREIKTRQIVKQFRIWKTQKLFKKGLQNLKKCGKVLRSAWNKLRGFVVRKKFLRKKKAVEILMKLLKKKLMKKIIRTILFKKWKKASEIFIKKEKQYFTELFFKKYQKCVKNKIIYIQNKRKIELMIIMNNNYRKRVREAKAKYIKTYKEGIALRRIAHNKLLQVFKITKRFVLCQNFSYLQDRIQERIEEAKEELLRLKEKEEEKKEVQENTKFQTVSNIGGFLRKMLVKKSIKKLNELYTKFLKFKGMNKYRDFSRNYLQIIENEEKNKGIHSMKELDLASEVQTKFFGKLNLRLGYKNTSASKGYYLKTIESLQTAMIPKESILTKGLLELKKFNAVEEIIKNNLISEDIHYEPKVVNSEFKSYVPINNNLTLWKNIASQWLNKRSSVSLITINHEDKKDSNISKELAKKFKNFTSEKNEEKQFLSAEEIVIMGFENSQNIKDEIFYNCFINMEKSPDRFMKLLALITSTFPSSRYKTPILNFLHALLLGTYSMETKEDEKMKEWTRYCYRRLEKSHELGPRTTLPNEEEFRYVWNMQKIPIRLFFCNEIPLWIAIESYTTVDEAIQLILKELKADNGFHRFLGLFVKFPEESFLDDDAWVVDFAMTKRIYIKIRYFVPLKDIKNKEFVNFLYVQMFFDYLKGTFPCPLEEIIELAGLAFFIEKGTQLEENESFSINKFIPKGCWRPEEVDINDVATKIITKYLNIRNYIEQEDAKINFLKILQKYEAFMAQGFQGDYCRVGVDGNKSNEEYCKQESTVFLKPFEIIFIWKIRGNPMKINLPLSKICEYGKLKEQKAVFFRVASENFDEIHMIESGKFEEIGTLMTGYVQLIGKKQNKLLFT